LFSIPVVCAVVQILLLVFVFPYDTPKMLKESGDYANLNIFMGKIYQPYAVQQRID
jgi:hypothetical protein